MKTFGILLLSLLVIKVNSTASNRERLNAIGHSYNEKIHTLSQQMSDLTSYGQAILEQSKHENMSIITGSSGDALRMMDNCVNIQTQIALFMLITDSRLIHEGKLIIDSTLSHFNESIQLSIGQININLGITTHVGLAQTLSELKKTLRDVEDLNGKLKAELDRKD